MWSVTVDLESRSKVDADFIQMLAKNKESFYGI